MLDIAAFPGETWLIGYWKLFQMRLECVLAKLAGPRRSWGVLDMNFKKGARNGFEKLKDDISHQEDESDIIRKNMAKIFDSKNLSFLLGSGCSSFELKDKNGKFIENGIPTMAPLAKEFQRQLRNNKNGKCDESEPGENQGHQDSRTEIEVAQEDSEIENVETTSIREYSKKIHEELGIDITSSDLSTNLEKTMSALISARQYCEVSGKDEALQSINNLINSINIFILKKCTSEHLSNEENCVLKIYKKFYECLGNRSRQISPPWVFTSNYDLFSELAMDRLNIPYSNGFSGTVERRFNPATYRLTLAEQLDITSRRWATVDRFVHFCKLHGSINWIDEGKGLYPIKEIHQHLDESTDRLMIYPTPSKQSASLSFPYSDMFREFHRQVVQDQSVLVVIGYGFGDEHINNIIFQGLTLPNFRIVIFADPDTNEITKELSQLADPRIWFIWGDIDKDSGQKSHYFNYIVDHLLPINQDQLESQKVVQETLKKIVNMATGSKNDDL